MGEFRTDCYFAILKRMREEFPNAHFELVMRRFGHVLSPSRELLDKCKKMKETVGQHFCSITVTEGDMWEFYTNQFLAEMRNNFAAVHAKLEELREIVKTKGVFLVCYEKDATRCHRSLVKKVLEREIVL